MKLHHHRSRDKASSHATPAPVDIKWIPKQYHPESLDNEWRKSRCRSVSELVKS